VRILVIEPDRAVAQSIELMLKSESMYAYTTDLGEECVELAKLYEYDLITLEIKLPDIDGFEVIRQIRAAKVKTPILVCSGFSPIEHKIKALSVGADDYVTKPFHKDELVARIHAIVRRSKGHAASTLSVGRLTLNMHNRTVAVDGQPVHLTNKEFGLVELLALRKGYCVSKEQMLSHLYGGMDEPEIKILDVFICKLRRKIFNATLAATGVGDGLVETMWGRGYCLPDCEVASPSLAPELADMVEHTGFVPLPLGDGRRKGRRRHASPSIVPEQGAA
jgi:two-component system cell cycle response regulator CtrA